MLYNDRGETPWGDETFNYRTPLAVAVSDDEGETWQRLGALTDESLNYCYFSLLFFDQGQRFIISAYESAFNHQPDGSVRRRNLASLKIWTGPTSLFRQERIS